MTAKVICFASVKGGTGKTVTASSLAKLLGVINKKVLLIDVDIDTNGLTLFYLHNITRARDSQGKERAHAVGIFEVLPDQRPMPSKLDSHTDIIPASYSMSKGISEKEFKKAISKVIESHSDQYDYIFLDAQAGTDSYAEIAIEHSDVVVIVSEFDPVSVEGIERFKGLFFRVLSKRKTWVLFNKVLPEFTQSMRGFLSVAGYLSPIPWDKDVMLAFAYRELAIDTENINEYTKAMIRTARSLMRQDAKDIDSWLSKKREAIRKPILDQLRETDQAIEGYRKTLISNRIGLESQRRRPIRFAFVFASILVISLSVSIAYDFPLEASILIVGFGVGAILGVYLFLSRMSKKEELLLELEISSISERLKELGEKRNKLRVLVEGDEKPD